MLPITTFTQQEIEAARRTISLRNAVFGGIYLVEISAMFFLYFRKRMG